ncbi:MAG: hypothetical protein M1838_003233 [Thelocarpon superellum]|nr:MAG: hypothetical protein M1838_003233 [Thelocarpon superellum]
MRNNTASSMQKTFDECYLKCSTAVYFEDQNNEAEALRSWRAALDQIYYHNAYRVSPHYRPRSETERALQESLRDMELRCKERVDLLDTLRLSRLDSSRNGTDDPSAPSSQSSQPRADAVKDPRRSSESERGFIGQGTIPAVTYPDLARPGPPLPQRPGFTKKGTPMEQLRTTSAGQVKAQATRRTSPTLPVAPLLPRTSRSPSPEKRGGLRTTLRTGRNGNRPSKSPRPSGQRKESGIAASKAATQAWGAISQPARDGIGRSHGETGSAGTLNAARKEGRDVSPLYRPESEGDARRRPSATENTPFIRPPSPSDFMPGRSTATKSTSRPSSQEARESRRPSTRSQYMEDLITLDPVEQPPRIAAIQRKVGGEIPRKKARSPPRPSTAAYEWPVYQSRTTSTAEKKPPPVPPHHARSGRAAPPTGASRAKSPLRKSRVTDHPPTAPVPRKAVAPSSMARKPVHARADSGSSEQSVSDASASSSGPPRSREKDRSTPTSTSDVGTSAEDRAWKKRVEQVMKHLPPGVDETAAKQIFNEIVVHGDEVHWDDVAGLDVAKNALKEAVVYPFLRPDLFMGLREPARGMLLFGPPGTGKTMLARAVATESRSTFFSISASSLTSKYLGESEKLVRALFALAKALAPSIIFVDEIDSLLSARSGTEHEASRRVKTEFLIQWSDLARAAAGREQSEKEKEKGDASRVLVLAATNLPWAIDEAARRRFVRRQYIPLPEGPVRGTQLRTLLGHQKHNLDEEDLQRLIRLTDGFSGSDITALAKDAAMGPLRSLGEALLHMSMDEIRPIQAEDFDASLVNIRPSVSKEGLKEFEEWARMFGERGG